MGSSKGDQRYQRKKALIKKRILSNNESSLVDWWFEKTTKGERQMICNDREMLRNKLHIDMLKYILKIDQNTTKKEVGPKGKLLRIIDDLKNKHDYKGRIKLLDKSTSFIFEVKFF